MPSLFVTDLDALPLRWPARHGDMGEIPEDPRQMAICKALLGLEGPQMTRVSRARIADSSSVDASGRG